ncbi:hypothetical protein [Mycolicibacterium sp.]|uniref:hypothetical protein n=1 Tax=Mycolicibacterium sp. TaxID=2320850 RepID=UPI003D0AF1BF
MYTTESHGGLLFPALALPTAPLPQVDVPPPTADKTAAMPRRRNTREQERQDRIDRERRKRLELNAERKRQREAWLAETYEPPPF